MINFIYYTALIYRMNVKEVLIAVNNKDEITNFILRSNAHKNQVLHRAIGVIIKKDNKIFVQKRSQNKDVFPGFYEASLSGHVSKDETYKTTALRELKEELGLNIKKSKLVFLGKKLIKTKKDNHFMTFYLLKISKQKIKIDNKEVAKGMFVSKTELLQSIKKNKFTPWNIEGLKLIN